MKTALEVTLVAINHINLDPIKIKLMDANEGEGWSRQKADAVEKEYRRFLLMTVTQQTQIVPTRDIDLFWHQHILDTRKYAADCEKTFGFFLHHFPYFGMRGEEDAANLERAFAETSHVYSELFGEPYHHNLSAENCSSCGPGSCGGAGCVNSTCSGDVHNTKCGSCCTDVLNHDLRPSFMQ